MACYCPFWCLRLIVMFAFRQKYKKIFSCVLHTTNTLTCFERSFFIQKILEVSKMCFRMDFLNTTKIILGGIHLLFTVNVFWKCVRKTPKGIGQYSKKSKNLILGGIHLLFTVNVWIKKSLKDEYPKYYWE